MYMRRWIMQCKLDLRRVQLTTRFFNTQCKLELEQAHEGMPMWIMLISASYCPGYSSNNICSIFTTHVFLNCVKL